MRQKEYLFAYGSLRPDEEPPKTMSKPVKDWIKADEIQMENPKKHHWAEVELKKPLGKVHGYTMLIDSSELAELDKREKPEYRRRKIKTDNGFDAWVYEFVPREDRSKSKNGWRMTSMA